ncbi:MAG: NAD(P)/FAD-dependent oxidoreductase [Acidimicrobiales bacterium]
MATNDRTTAPTSTATLDFDPDALRDRYRAERDKRRRPDGNDQYVNVVGELAHYLTDPYVEDDAERPPLRDDVEVVIVGGGFGGLLAGARLREAGFDDLRLIEKGGDVGGTWYWNRYPGAMCDVESYVYLPLLEEMGAVPSEKYAKAPEILAHSQAIARHFDLYRNACFGTEVTEAAWDDESERWIITTNRGDRMRARYLIMSNGPLHRPKLPGIPGVTSFGGHSFHTSRWDYAYTGGDPTGGLTGLADKRVAIIGSGATAVQCIPHLGEGAKQLFVFQRTPSSIDVRNNRPTATDWADSLEPGWQQRRMDNFNTLVSGGFAEEDLVNDGWTDIIGKLLFRVANDADADLSPEGLAATMELADFEKMNQIRARVDEIVKDVATAEALKPWYRQFCKRPCFHDEYLDTYNRDNVTLVDTRGQGVNEITERGVVFDGVEYEVDCIIYATGFEVGTDYTRRSGYELVGRNGLTLTEKWEDGVSTFHGLFSRGFPNCFIMGHLQSGFTVNYPHLLNEQSQHLAHILRTAIDAGTPIIEAQQAAEDDWVQTIIGLARNTQEFLESCTPGYYNNEGRPAELSGRNGSYGAGSIAFFQLLADWRAEGTMPGLDLRPLTAPED